MENRLISDKLRHVSFIELVMRTEIVTRYSDIETQLIVPILLILRSAD